MRRWARRCRRLCSTSATGSVDRQERAMATERRYLFSPLERRGVVAGLRAGQLAVLSAGLVTGIAVLRAAPSAVGLAVALTAVGASLSVGFLAIGDRALDQWVPVAARYGALRLRRRRASR